MNLEACQIFTPKETVIYMLDLIDYRKGIFGKTVIDNSCGHGNFLVEVVKRFVEDGIQQNISKTRIKNALQKCVWGCDIDEKCIEICVDNLNTTVALFGIKNVKWNILKHDGLYLSDDMKFDYVVGNPPYISYLDLDSDVRIQTRDNFKSCSIGKFDYSYAFIEKGLRILKNNGKMVMITPANMFKTVFAENLRSIIKTDLTLIVDCSAKKIFDDVLTTPAITVYEKGSRASVLIYQEMHTTGIKNERVIDKSTLLGKWNFTDYISSGKRRFGDYFKASNCIATLANKIFIHTQNEQGGLDIDVEKGALRDAKSPKSEQFGIKQKIIFPYYYKNGELKNYSEEAISQKFPKLMGYLASKKEELKLRDSDKNAKWYEFGRSQALRYINNNKLLISTIITKSVKVYELNANEVPYSGIYIIPRDNASLQDAKMILQTERFYNYLLTKGVKVSGDSIRISSKDVEEYRY